MVAFMHILSSENTAFAENYEKTGWCSGGGGRYDAFGLFTFNNTHPSFKIGFGATQTEA